MKNVLCRITTALCALLVALPVATVFAAVDFTKDGAADQASIYVAGNPDCFPVESYDADSGTYKGAGPAFRPFGSGHPALDLGREGHWLPGGWFGPVSGPERR